MKTFVLAIILLFSFAPFISGQPPREILAQQIEILKGEDSRDIDLVLPLMTSGNSSIRNRAVLAAGRIGDEKAVDALIVALDDAETAIQETAAFSLGEIESPKAATAIINTLKKDGLTKNFEGRLIEAAGKIAAANPNTDASAKLGVEILNFLKRQNASVSAADKEAVLLGLTAIMRAKPANADAVISKFLTSNDPRVRADAVNAGLRMRSRSSAEALKKMLASDTNPDARANAARALAQSPDSAKLLLDTLTRDQDVKVRVMALRSLATVGKINVAADLVNYGRMVLNLTSKPGYAGTYKRYELNELATTLGTILKGSKNEPALDFLADCRKADNYISPEIAIAIANISPERLISDSQNIPQLYTDHRAATAYVQGLNVLAEGSEEFKVRGSVELMSYVENMGKRVKGATQANMLMALPEFYRVLGNFKPDNFADILIGALDNEDIFIRAVAAELIGGLPYSKASMDALNKASAKSTIRDKQYNDAQLAIMDAAFKLNKKESLGIVLGGLNSPDYLVRRKAFELLKEVDTNESPGVPTLVDAAIANRKDHVLPYVAARGTRLGQVLNKDADYRRALLRKNGATQAVFTTDRGTFTINLLPEDAPLTVDNFINLAKAKYFNGLLVHRVVANFVMQDGDPRGDGNGGPGWSIRCEVNPVSYERGSVGMALSGKDTGGSQWFVTHAPTPHLDGGYTVFGRVSESDMTVVDNIARGDKIISVKIVEGSAPRPRRGRRR